LSRTNSVSCTNEIKVSEKLRNISRTMNNQLRTKIN